MFQQLSRAFFALVLAAGAGLGSAADAAAPVEKVLPNGIRIVCKQETATPLVAVDVFVKVGAAQEQVGQSGLSELVARTVLASTSNHTPEGMTTAINDLGGSLTVAWQPDWTQINTLAVADQFDNAAYLLADVLKNADFEAGAVEDARTQLLTEIDQGDASPFGTAYAGIRRTLYAGTSQAGPQQGTQASVRALTRADLVGFFSRYYVPQNIVFVVVGNIDPDTAIRKIGEDMDDFPQGRGGRRSQATTTPQPAPTPLLTQDPPPVRTYQVNLSQVCVMVGYPAPALSSGDYAAMQVTNALLGGMKSSRLFTNVRDVKGLGYDLGSVYTPGLYTGDIDGYVFAPPTWTDPATKKTGPTLGLVKDLVLQQFQSMTTTSPTPAEIARAEHFLIGTYKIKHERLEDRASLLGQAEIASPQGYKWDSDYATYIGAVTAADVQRVSQKYFAHPAVSTVEPAGQNDGVVSG